MLRKLSILSIYLAVISFISSWAWVIININQPSRGLSHRMNSFQNMLFFTWLVSMWVAVLLVIFVILTRDTIVDQEGRSYTLGKLVVLSLSFIIITPHFSALLFVIFFDVIFQGL